MSEILDIANDMARDLFKVGAMDEITMRKIDALCLPPQSKAVRLGGIENYERKRHESRVHQSNRST